VENALKFALISELDKSNIGWQFPARCGSHVCPNSSAAIGDTTSVTRATVIQCQTNAIVLNTDSEFVPGREVCIKRIEASHEPAR
jgi:hypothetical protein